MLNTIHTDVIVVGLGAFGSATLFQLASRGVRAIGIDQFHPPHDRGSTHGSTRITRLAVGEGDNYVPLIRRSHEIWAELEARTGQKLFHRVGGLIIGALDGRSRHHGKENFLARTVAAARQFGIEHELLGPAEVAYRYPQFVITSSEHAFFEPSAGALVPEACVQTQMDLARQLGAGVRFNETVLSIEESQSGVIVTTTADRYAAGKVVVTAGPWTPGLTTGPVKKHLRVLRQVLYWFKPTDAAPYRASNCPVFIWMHGQGDSDYLYGFPMVDDKRGVKVATEQYDVTCDPDAYERTVSDAEAREMYARHVDGRLRSVSPVTTHRAACLYTVSSDSGFIVDRYRDMDNAIVVSACSGHGFKNSAGLGESLALEVIGQGRGELTPFSVDRFQ